MGKLYLFVCFCEARNGILFRENRSKWGFFGGMYERINDYVSPGQERDSLFGQS